MQSAVLAMIDSVRLSLCLSVRPSQFGIMSKQYDYGVFTAR